MTSTYRLLYLLTNLIFACSLVVLPACGSPSALAPSALKDQFSGSDFYYYDLADRKEASRFPGWQQRLV